jgi:hypothetical protein
MGELILNYLLADGRTPSELWKFYGYSILEEWEFMGDRWEDSLL